MTIRVLIADDQQLVRTGFRMILDSEPDIEVVGEAVTDSRHLARLRTAARRRADGHPHAGPRRHRGHPPLAAIGPSQHAEGTHPHHL